MADEKILVVDDTKIVCLGLEAELTDAGYQVNSAYSGEEAVEKVKQEKFDLVLCDMVMPGMNGVDTCWEIKRICPETEVVLVSGHPDEVEKRKDAFIEAGGSDHFVRKPFLEGEIVEIIRKLFEEKRKK